MLQTTMYVAFSHLFNISCLQSGFNTNQSLTCLFCNSQLQSYFKIKFFHLLDVVSLSAYFRLLFTDKVKTPTLEQTIGLFKWRATRIQRWLQATGLTDKGVLVAEVGFQSKGTFRYERNFSERYVMHMEYSPLSRM